MSSASQHTPLVPFDEGLPPPIPHGILPGILGEYAVAVASAVQVPFELPLINALGAVAAVSQRKFIVQVHGEYTEPVNIYALAVLPPGERKSAAVEACRFPLQEWEAEEQRRFIAKQKQVDAEQQVHEEAARSLLAAARRCQTPESRKELARQLAMLKEEVKALPAPMRLLADDVTPEALAALMDRHNQRIALLESEGGFFDTLAGRYSGMPNFDLILKAWDGGASRTDRRHNEPILLDNPALTLVLSVQPDVLAGAAQTPSFRGRGLLGRFLFLLPRSLVGKRNIETFPIPTDLRQRYSDRLRHLLTLPWNTNSRGEQAPYILTLDHNARAEWHAFAAQVERSLAEGGSLAGLRDWGGKLPGQILRLAGLCHATLLDLPHSQQIQADTMRSVITLADLLTEHARAAFCLLGVDDNIECAKAILKWIIDEQRQNFTARDCLEKIKGRWPKMSLVNPGLVILEERGFIFPAERERQGRGRPSKVYYVNPLVFGQMP